MPLTEEQVARIQGEYSIPVDSTYPLTNWIVSLDQASQMPTDEELRQLASFIEYFVSFWYGERRAERILSEPLPKSPEHHTTIFVKCGISPDIQSWAYRRANWEIGPVFRPDISEQVDRLTLVEVLDLETQLAGKSNESWEEWKQNNAGIFPALINS